MSRGNGRLRSLANDFQIPVELKNGAPPPSTSLSSPMSSAEPPVTPPNTKSLRQGTAFPAEIPHDPLLDPGPFIDAAGMGTENLLSSQANGKGRDTQKKMVETPVSRRSSLTAETSNGSESGMKGSNTRDPNVAARSVSSEKPSWLPKNWVVEDRVRTSGATAGTVDKSKLPKSDNIETLASKFDFAKVAKKVDWVLTNCSEGSWAPFIGDGKIPEAVKREWSTAFTVLTSKTGAQHHACT